MVFRLTDYNSQEIPDEYKEMLLETAFYEESSRKPFHLIDFIRSIFKI